MKKIFLIALLACPAMGAFASPQYVITDCGTVHRIADNATMDQAVEALNRFSEEDCN